MRPLDYAAIKRAVPIMQVLTSYGLLERLRPLRAEALIGPCPLHGGDNPTAFRVQLDRGLWHCFSRCGGGNVLDLLARLENIDVAAAASRLEALARTLPPLDVPPTAGPEPSQLPLAELPFRLQLTPHSYLDTRGLQAQTCSHFGVGYCSRGMLTGCIAIPIHDYDGRLVAYAGRRLPGATTEGKYRFPRGFPKSHLLYNGWRIPPTARELVVVEGFFDVFLLHQAGYPDTVALMGSHASEKQMHWLMAHQRHLVLMLDGDDAGRAGQRELERALHAHGHPHRSIHLREGMQPEHLAPCELSALLGTRPSGSSSLNQ